MAKYWFSIGALVLAMTIMAGCAPAAPAPATPPQAAPAAPILSPSEAAWQKVIDAAKKEGMLTAYSYNMTADVGVAVSRAFKEKYGIRMEIITGGGSALAARIKTEKRTKNMVADVMDANTFQISHIKDAGATVSSEEIPVL